MKKTTLMPTLLIALILIASGSAANAQDAPEMESEFFNDYTKSVSSGERISISRTLRKASDRSDYQTMIVVINSVADYPKLPQDVLAFSAELVNRWRKADPEYAPELLILFALKDKKYAVSKGSNVSQKLSDAIKQEIDGRTKNELRNNRVGRAMRLASEAIADTLPDRKRQSGKAQQKPTTQNSTNRAVTPPPQRRPTRVRKRRGFSFGWIIGIIVIVMIISFVSSLFRGSRRGYGGGMGGGYFGGGGGSFLGGMLTGGLLGSMFGGGRGWGSQHDHYDDGYGGGGQGGDFGGGDYGGGDDWGGGGFDGGDFDGGGSFGEW